MLPHPAIARASATLAFLLLIPLFTLAANLKGVVFSDTGGQRVAHASLSLCDEGGNIVQQGASSDSGEFAFLGVRPGPYLLKVVANGFESADVSVDLNFASERGISIFLKPVHSTKTPNVAAPSISAHELSMPEAARKLFSSGMQKLYAGKDPQGALTDFQAALQKAPQYYEAWYQLAMAQLALRNAPEAEKSLQKSVDLSLESYADADLALAVLWLGRHDAARGEPLLRRSLELNPGSWKANFELGKLEMYRGHLPEALSAAQRAQTLAPQQPLVYRLLSLVHLKQNNLAAAIVDLDNYIRLDPDSQEGTRAKELRQQTADRLSKPDAQAAPASTSP